MDAHKEGKENSRMKKCRECEEEIEQKRLRANPNAIFCVVCQEDQEIDKSETRIQTIVW